jgi:hypothetical protein
MSTNILEAVTEDKLTVAYNPNLLVTYKAMPNTYAAPEAPTFLTAKVVDIEWDLHLGRTKTEKADKLEKLIAGLDEQVIEWTNPNYDKDEVLAGICEYFGINPTKEITIRGTVEFSGTIRVPISEAEDFDMSNVSVDVELSSYDYEADLYVDEVNLEERY